MKAPSWLTALPVAHRGLHDASAGRIENTLAAVTAAVERGFAVEVDLRLTADGEAVVFHDERLDRLTSGTGALAARSLSELKALRFPLAGNDGDTIPTLGELLEAVAGRVPLFLELKAAPKGNGHLERRVAELLVGYAGEAALMSFSASSMSRLAKQPEDRPRGLIAASNAAALAGLAQWRLAERSLPDFLAFDTRALPAFVAAAFRRRGRPVMTWTVRSMAEAAHARAHADQIIFEGFDPSSA